MLTTKNRGGKYRVFFLAHAALLAALLVGCSPSGPRALERGKWWVEQGRYEEALAELKQASAWFNQTNAEAWNNLGLAYHGAGQWSNAVTAYQRALALTPHLGEAHYNLGCLWLEQNRLELAKREFMSYTSLPGSVVEGWLKLGTAQFRSREWAAAEKSFQEALRINQSQPEALNGLGLIELQRNKPQEAAQLFAKALKPQPDYPPALLNWAVVLQLQLNDRKLALQKYREYLALPLRPANWETVNATARALELELNGTAKTTPGNATTAKLEPATNSVRSASVERVAMVKRPTEPAVAPRETASVSKLTPAAPATPRVAPTSAPASTPTTEKPGFFARMNPLNLFRRDVSDTGATPSQAAGTIARYKYQTPARPAVGDESAASQAFTQGLQAQQSKRAPEALQAYRQATRLNPAYFDAHYNLGLTAASVGDLSQALLAYETALTIRPESSAARYNFALVLKQANYPADAVNELEQVLAVSPRDARAHLALGNLYAQQLRQPAKARAHYLKVLECDPQNPQAAGIRHWLNVTPP